MVTCRASSNRVRGHETPGEENGGRDARLDHRQPNADGGHPLVPDRAADLGQRKEGVQGGPPFRDRLFDQREDEGVDDLVDRLAGLHRPAEVGAGLLVDGGTGPVTAARGLDGGHREAVLRRVVPGPGHQPGVALVQSAVVAAQDQRGRCGSRRPQDAGDLAEGEFAFEDAVVEALFRSESHGRAFRECS